MESNIAWADRHVNFRSMWRDNTHLNGSQSRSVKSLTQDTTPGPIPRAKSQVRWRFNHASFPAKPAGFDALLQVIENDAKAGGGWPPALTPAIIEQFQTKGP